MSRWWILNKKKAVPKGDSEPPCVLLYQPGMRPEAAARCGARAISGFGPLDAWMELIPL
jgi:hypothetical protein